MPSRAVQRLFAAITAGLSLSWGAAAWWDGGHMQVVLVATAQMNSERVVELAELLQAHPDYERDFLDAMPESLRNAPQQARAEWLLARAATWPDLVRDRSHPGRGRHDHPTWHYINLPIYLNESDRSAFVRSLPANTAMTWSEEDDGATELNVVQALERAAHTFAAPGTPEPERAIALCWLLHLIGDIHQPLHSTAVFSKSKLPEGDKGGNLVLVRGRQTASLHRLWDSAPGTAEDYDAVQRMAESYLGLPELVERGRAAATELNAAEWVQESHRIARDVVYTPYLLGQIRASAPNDRGAYGPFEMSSAYFRWVDEIARIRIVEAGYRAAAVLKQEDPPGETEQTEIPSTGL